MSNIVFRCICSKCGKETVMQSIVGKQYEIGDEISNKCCGILKVVAVEEIPSNPQKHLYERRKMTDKEIGKTAREIAERGNTAEVKRNKEGILILEVEKKIVKSDKERG